MKQIVTILLMVSVITVQSIDIGLDLDAEALESTHSDLGIDNHQPIADHDIHCGCDIFHHVVNINGNSSNSFPWNQQIVFNGLDHLVDDQNNGPPVPPPLA